MADLRVTSNTGGSAVTQPSGQGNRQAAAAIGDSVNAILSMAESTRNVNARNAQAIHSMVKDSVGVISYLDSVRKQVRETQDKSAAQDEVLRATMSTDERIQALMHDPSVNPLDLADKADEIIVDEQQKSAKNSINLSPTMRDYVDTKMDSIRASRVPQVRREGYSREGEVQVAATSRRNFSRKAELNKPGTTLARRAELTKEIVDDIQSLGGVHMSWDKVQRQIEAEVEGQASDMVLGAVLDNPQAALGMIDMLPFDNQKKMALTNQAKNIIAMAENDRIRMENAARQKKKELGEGAFKMAIDEMILNDADPRQWIADPRFADVTTGPQHRTLIAFHDSLLKSKDDIPSTPSTVLSATTWVQEGTATPKELADGLTLMMEDGHLTGKDGKKLLNEGIAAFQRERAIHRTDFKESWAKGEGDIKRFLQFEPGFISLFDKDHKTELNLALSTGLKMYRQEMGKALKYATENNLDPNTTIDASALADEALLRVLPLARNAMAPQKVSSQTFQRLFTEMKAELNPGEINQLISVEVEGGRLTMPEARILRSAHQLAVQFEKLKVNQSTRINKPNKQ